MKSVTIPGYRKPAVPFTVPFADGDGEAIFDPYNGRIKLYDWTPQDIVEKRFGQILKHANATEAEVSKLTVYARGRDTRDWNDLGFHWEATIRGYFEDRSDANVFAYFPDATDRGDHEGRELDEFVAIAQAKDRVHTEMPEELQVTEARFEEADELSDFLTEHFADYPTPTHRQFIRDLITTGESYFLLVRNKEGKLVASASLEIDKKRGVAEVSDCLTLPELRGQGVMTSLILLLEKAAVENFGIRDLYTLARAPEVGMNCTFAKVGYDYTGRLVNNCRMPTGWESIHVWCKQLER
jgi:putative beta-lysine N-acetyltransferase